MHKSENFLSCKISDEKPFKCSQCESSFRKSSGLKQHVTRQHSQNAPQKIPPALSNQVSTKKSSTASDRPYACQVTHVLYLDKIMVQSEISFMTGYACSCIDENCEVRLVNSYITFRSTTALPTISILSLILEIKTQIVQN